MISTVAAVILIVIGASLDHHVCTQDFVSRPFGFLNFFTALGTIVFAFSGHTVFPTIQHDMRRPGEFTKSCIMAFSAMAILYAPVIVMGSYTYGDSLKGSVIESIQTSAIQQTINLMIAVHCMLTVTLEINPISQDTEDFFRVPHTFGIKRVLIRTGVMVAILIVAESIPAFGSVLDLVGASTLTLICMVFPPIFYLYLNAREKKLHALQHDHGIPSFGEIIQYNDKRIVVACAFIVIIGLVGGIAATYSAIVELSTYHFATPCWIKVFKHSTSSVNTRVNCCGPKYNTTVFGEDPMKYCRINE